MNEGHNSKARGDIIREIKAGLDEVNQSIANLMETRKRIKGRIKADLGMKVADWSVMIRFAELEDDSRQELFTTIREGFSALNIGQQASFLDIIDPRPETTEEPIKPKGKRKTKAEQIAEIILADSQPSPEQLEADGQRAADAEKFDAPAEVELAD